MKKVVWLLMTLMPFAVMARDILPETLRELKSPDGHYCFTFYQRASSRGGLQMYYTITYKDSLVIEESELGVLIDNRLFESALAVPNDTCTRWCENLQLFETEQRSVDAVWHPVYGERRQVRDCYKEMVLRFRKGEGEKESVTGYDKRKNYLMNIVVRAYNEGVAFRYHFPETTNGLFLHIVGEQTAFSFPTGTKAYFERWAQGPYEFRPLEGWAEEESERPLTLKLPNGWSVALTEAEMVDYVRGKFRLSSEKPWTLVTSLYDCADVISPYSTPWRVLMVGELPTDLINNNDLILNLNAPCQLADASWIKPGKVFRAGRLHQEGVKAAIDFAAAQNMQYVHMDAGWYGPEMKVSSDATTVATERDLDIPSLCRYAESKGVGVMVYVNQRALVQQLDSLLPLYKKWGLKGIKFGFVHVGNQHWSTWLHEAVRKCARYGMLVDIHDEYRPTGFSRTYPNLMTQEGIRGNEEMPDATHNVILPYTRFLAGAADYTLCYFNTRVKNTKAHQLAMAAVYYSPLQFLFWYDTPDAYRGEAELEFWKHIPTVWDDSRALAGEVGEYIVQARRSGDDWFVGAMTNSDARVVTVDTDFLQPGKLYSVAMYEDDDTLKTRTKVRITHKRVKAGTPLGLSLLPSGGAALHFTLLSETQK